MRVLRLHPPFDHGAALRVPPPQDRKSWAMLWSWLGEDAQSVDKDAKMQQAISAALAQQLEQLGFKPKS